MRTVLATAILAMAMLVAACDGASGVAADPPLFAAKSPRMVPAWKTSSGLKLAGQPDQYSDYRAQHPDLYAITAPPGKAGFRSFVEWEPMQTILLSYTGFDAGYQAVGNSILQMIQYGVDTTDFTVLVPDSATQSVVVQRLKGFGVAQATIDAKVHFLTYTADSIWTIDFGPFPLVDPAGAVGFADFRYYPERTSDDSVPTLLGNLWGVTSYRAPLDLEGGNFTSDGKGTCYTSQQTFLSNADKTDAQIREVFREYLGCDKVIVLIPEEDGTGHIDMFSKHVAPSVYVLGKATTANSSAKTVKDLELNLDILQGAVLADGSSLTVHRIPMPYQNDGVWRTYTNSTFANGVNLVPVYPDFPALEADAMAVWQQAMPDWTHVGIDSDLVISWGGAMHCVSRQVPAGALSAWVPDGTCTSGTCQGAVGGYAGACQDSTQCTGPAWLCLLNECNGSADPCGGLTAEGCCDGRTVRYCENRAPQAQDCGTGATCGWSSGDGWYDCGYSGADPSGSFPIACPGACTPACSGRECGTDGCSGSCGDCADGGSCDASGSCVPAPVEPTPDAIDDPGPSQDLAAELPGADEGACVASCPPGWCGENGCGGRCAECAAGFWCNAQSHCVADVSPGTDLLESDALSEDSGPATDGRNGGGCAAGSSRAGSPVPAGLVLGIMALIVLRFVYTTARE
jgi:agmatine/peptidylarginine deiminase